MHAFANRGIQAGQSLVEFAISSLVLVLLFGGLVDLTRAIHYADVVQGAAREGARYGAVFLPVTPDNPSVGVWYPPGNAHLADASIKSAVDAQLTAGGLPPSILKNATGPCPAVADTNTVRNPPYANAAFPAVTNQPWLFICYDNDPAKDYPVTPPVGLEGKDLNVILTMSYGPLTGAIPIPLGGNLGIASNVHLRIQG